MTHSRTEQPERTRTVRPRWTWIALLVMFAGVLVIAWGDIQSSWAWVVPGVVVLAVGAGLALYGGFFYDVQGGSSASAQAQDVIHGAEHEFPVAGTMRSESEVKRDVRRRWLRGRG
jgi:hypothetical protein